MYIKNLLSQNSKITFKQDFTYTFQSVRANLFIHYFIHVVIECPLMVVKAYKFKMQTSFVEATNTPVFHDFPSVFLATFYILDTII